MTPTETGPNSNDGEDAALASAPDDQPMQALTVRLPQDLYEKLRRAAFEQHTSMNALIINAVREVMR